MKHASAFVTQRHNMLVDALADLARSVGATVRTSQPRLGTALVTVTDETSGEGRRELQDSGLRGDLLMALSAERILVDVTVPRATAMSNMHLPPGACVKGAELVVGQVSRSAAQRHTPVHHVSKTSSRASGVPVASLTLCPFSLGRDVCSFQPALSTRRLSPARGSTRARRHTLSAQCLSSQRQSTPTVVYQPIDTTSTNVPNDTESESYVFTGEDRDIPAGVRAATHEAQPVRSGIVRGRGPSCSHGMRHLRAAPL